MKRFLLLLALLLTLSVSAQTFQVATQIVASHDCKLKFLNKIDSQIYEVNSVDMTWQYLTTTTIKIKDYDNEVTVYKNNITSPIFANIPDFLDSVQGACLDSGGGGVQSIVAGTNVTVDNSDPQNPIVSASGGSGSDSTIYKADGSTDELRTANFNDGLLLHNNNLDDYIILGQPTGNETGIYGNEGASSVSVRSNFTTINADTTIFVNYNPIGEFDSLEVEFLQLPQKDNLPYLLGVDTSTVGIAHSSKLYRTTANFLPLIINENTVVQIPDTSTYLQIGQDGNAFNIKKPVPIEFSGFAEYFSGLDYTIGDIKSFVGILYGVNSTPLGLVDLDLVGNFTIIGDYLSGDYNIAIQATSLDNVAGIINIKIVFVDGDIASASSISLENDRVEVSTGIDFLFDNSGLSLSDGDNTLIITPESILVPTPPPTGNYVLKSIGGVVSWVAE